MKIGYLMQAGVPEVRKQPLSGPANHVIQVISNLQRLGHHVCMIANIEGQIWKSDDLEVFKPITINWFDSGIFRRFESVVRRIQYELRLPYAALFESLRFAQACRQELSGYDLFYERMGWVGYGGGLAAKWLGIPLVLEVNGDHLSELEIMGIAPKGAQLWLSTILMQRGVEQASFVVATGAGWRKKFIERWGVKPEIVVVIENGSEIVELLKREQLRAFQSHTQNTRLVTVIYIGSFETWHGVTELLHAIGKSVAHGVLLRLVLVGSGKQQRNIERLISDLNLRNQVDLKGYLPINEMAGYLADSDIGVSPYCGRVEYSGLKLLDYKAAGLATIASGENGQPAIIEHGYTGWIVPPCNEEALCDAIVRLACDPDLRKRLGREARKEAERTHSWQHTAEQLSQVFEQVILEQ